MIIRIYVLAEPGAYSDFNLRGVFIGNADQLADAYLLVGTPEENARAAAKMLDVGLKVYDVPEFAVREFCRGYGNAYAEPLQFEVTL